jgi:hypothetical protein
MPTKHILCYKNFLEIKTYQRAKVKTKEHNNEQNINICIRNLGTNKERQKVFEHFWKESV